MPNEIVSFQVGQAGNQIGREFTKQLCYEHYIDPHGFSLLSPYLSTLPQFTSSSLDAINTYFSSSVSATTNQPIYHSDSTSFQQHSFASSVHKERYTPRTILLDSEPMVIQKGLSTHFCRDLYSPSNILLHPDNASAGNNWFQGYDLLTSSDQYFSTILDRTQNELEKCDNLSGFQLTHSLAGGTGSGLGSGIIELILHDYYPKKNIFTFSVLDDPMSSTVSTAAYNTILTLSRLIEYTQGVFTIDNHYFSSIFPQLVQDVLLSQTSQQFPARHALFPHNNTQHSFGNREQFSKQKGLFTFTQQDINYCIAQLMAQLTAPLRFTNTASNPTTCSLNSYLSSLTWHPRCHFYTTNFLPLSHHFQNLPCFVDYIQEKNKKRVPIDMEAVRLAGISLPPGYQAQQSSQQQPYPHQHASQHHNSSNEQSSLNYQDAQLHWLQAQLHAQNKQSLNKHTSSGTNTMNANKSSTLLPSAYFTSPPPLPQHHSSLVDSYISTLHHQHFAAHIPSSSPSNSTPTGKYLTMTFLHSFNAAPTTSSGSNTYDQFETTSSSTGSHKHTPQSFHFQHAKKALSDRYSINFVHDQPHSQAHQHHHNPQHGLNHENNPVTHHSLFPILSQYQSSSQHSRHHHSSSSSSSSSLTPPITTLSTIPTFPSFLSKLPYHHNLSAPQPQINSSNPTTLYNFDSMCVVNNNTNFKHILSQQVQQFANLYNKRAWISQYTHKSTYFNHSQASHKPTTDKRGNKHQSKLNAPPLRTISIDGYSAAVEMERAVAVVQDLIAEYDYLETQFSTDPYNSSSPTPSENPFNLHHTSSFLSQMERAAEGAKVTIRSMLSNINQPKDSYEIPKQPHHQQLQDPAHVHSSGVRSTFVSSHGYDSNLSQNDPTDDQNNWAHNAQSYDEPTDHGNPEDGLHRSHGINIDFDFQPQSSPHFRALPTPILPNPQRFVPPSAKQISPGLDFTDTNGEIHVLPAKRGRLGSTHQLLQQHPENPVPSSAHPQFQPLFEANKQQSELLSPSSSVLRPPSLVIPPNRSTTHRILTPMNRKQQQLDADDELF